MASGRDDAGHYATGKRMRLITAVIQAILLLAAGAGLVKRSGIASAIWLAF